MMEERKKDNDCLWMLKGISCIIVILFHCPMVGILGDGIKYALRFPIPVFFMSTGYFMYGKDNYLSKVKLFLRYLIFGEMVAFISVILRTIIMSSTDAMFHNILNSFSVRMIFFGSIFNGTLWYLYAMVWAYVLLFLISKYKYGFKIGYYFIIPLLFIHITGRVYVTRNYDINEYVFLFRSAILFAIPFLLIGRIIAEKQKNIEKYLNYVNIGGMFFLGMALMFYEFFRWHQFMDLQVSTIFISISLFLFTLYRPEFSLGRLFKYIGKNLLFYMYIFHIPVINLIQIVFDKVGVDNGNVLTIVVVIVTFFVSYLWVNLKKMLINKGKVDAS